MDEYTGMPEGVFQARLNQKINEMRQVVGMGGNLDAHGAEYDRIANAYRREFPDAKPADWRKEAWALPTYQLGNRDVTFFGLDFETSAIPNGGSVTDVSPLEVTLRPYRWNQKGTGLVPAGRGLTTLIQPTGMNLQDVNALLQSKTQTKGTVAEMTGLNAQMWASPDVFKTQLMSQEEAVKQIATMLQSSTRPPVILGHNILGFDIPLLNRLLEASGEPNLQRLGASVIDTQSVLRKLDVVPESLAEGSRRFGLPQTPEHRTFKDVQRSAQVFNRAIPYLEVGGEVPPTPAGAYLHRPAPQYIHPITGSPQTLTTGGPQNPEPPAPLRGASENKQVPLAGRVSPTFQRQSMDSFENMLKNDLLAEIQKGGKLGNITGFTIDTRRFDKFVRTSVRPLMGESKTPGEALILDLAPGYAVPTSGKSESSYSIRRMAESGWYQLFGAEIFAKDLENITIRNPLQAFGRYVRESFKPEILRDRQLDPNRRFGAVTAGDAAYRKQSEVAGGLEWIGPVHTESFATQAAGRVSVAFAPELRDTDALLSTLMNRSVLARIIPPDQRSEDQAKWASLFRTIPIKDKAGQIKLRYAGYPADEGDDEEVLEIGKKLEDITKRLPFARSEREQADILALNPQTGYVEKMQPKAIRPKERGMKMAGYRYAGGTLPGETEVRSGVVQPYAVTLPASILSGAMQIYENVLPGAAAAGYPSSEELQIPQLTLYQLARAKWKWGRFQRVQDGERVTYTPLYLDEKARLSKWREFLTMNNLKESEMQPDQLKDVTKQFQEWYREPVRAIPTRGSAIVGVMEYPSKDPSQGMQTVPISMGAEQETYLTPPEEYQLHIPPEWVAGSGKAYSGVPEGEVAPSEVESSANYLSYLTGQFGGKVIPEGSSRISLRVPIEVRKGLAGKGFGGKFTLNPIALPLGAQINKQVEIPLGEGQKTFRRARAVTGDIKVPFVKFLSGVLFSPPEMQQDYFRLFDKINPEMADEMVDYLQSRQSARTVLSGEEVEGRWSSDQLGEIFARYTGRKYRWEKSAMEMYDAMYNLFAGLSNREQLKFEQAWNLPTQEYPIMLQPQSGKRQVERRILGTMEEEVQGMKQFSGRPTPSSGWLSTAEGRRAYRARYGTGFLGTREAMFEFTPLGMPPDREIDPGTRTRKGLHAFADWYLKSTGLVNSSPQNTETHPLSGALRQVVDAYRQYLSSGGTMLDPLKREPLYLTSVRAKGMMGPIVFQPVPEHMGKLGQVGYEEMAALWSLTPDIAQALGLGLYDERGAEATGFLPKHVKAWREFGDYAKFQTSIAVPKVVPDDAIRFRSNDATANFIASALLQSKDDMAEFERILQEGGLGQGQFYNEDTGQMWMRPGTIDAISTHDYKDDEDTKTSIAHLSRAYPSATRRVLAGETVERSPALSSFWSDVSKVYKSQGRSVAKGTTSRFLEQMVTGRYFSFQGPEATMGWMDIGSLNNALDRMARNKNIDPRSKVLDPVTGEEVSWLTLSKRQIDRQGYTFELVNRSPTVQRWGGVQGMPFVTSEILKKQWGINFPEATYVTGAGQIVKGDIFTTGWAGGYPMTTESFQGDWDADQILRFLGAVADPKAGLLLPLGKELKDQTGMGPMAVIRRGEEMMRIATKGTKIDPGGEFNVLIKEMKNLLEANLAADGQAVDGRLGMKDGKPVSFLKKFHWPEVFQENMLTMKAEGMMGTSYVLRQTMEAIMTARGWSDQSIARTHTGMAGWYQTYIDKMTKLIKNRGGLRRLENLFGTGIFGVSRDDQNLQLLFKPESSVKHQVFWTTEFGRNMGDAERIASFGRTVAWPFAEAVEEDILGDEQKTPDFKLAALLTSVRPEDSDDLANQFEQEWMQGNKNPIRTILTGSKITRPGLAGGYWEGKDLTSTPVVGGMIFSTLSRVQSQRKMKGPREVVVTDKEGEEHTVRVLSAIDKQPFPWMGRVVSMNELQQTRDIQLANMLMNEMTRRFIWRTMAGEAKTAPYPDEKIAWAAGVARELTQEGKPIPPALGFLLSQELAGNAERNLQAAGFRLADEMSEAQVTKYITPEKDITMGSTLIPYLALPANALGEGGVRIANQKRLEFVAQQFGIPAERVQESIESRADRQKNIGKGVGFEAEFAPQMAEKEGMYLRDEKGRVVVGPILGVPHQFGFRERVANVIPQEDDKFASLAGTEMGFNVLPDVLGIMGIGTGQKPGEMPSAQANSGLLMASFKYSNTPGSAVKKFTDPVITMQELIYRLSILSRRGSPAQLKPLLDQLITHTPWWEKDWAKPPEGVSGAAWKTEQERVLNLNLEYYYNALKKGLFHRYVAGVPNEAGEAEPFDLRQAYDVQGTPLRGWDMFSGFTEEEIHGQEKWAAESIGLAAQEIQRIQQPRNFRASMAALAARIGAQEGAGNVPPALYGNALIRPWEESTNRYSITKMVEQKNAAVEAVAIQKARAQAPQIPVNQEAVAQAETQEAIKPRYYYQWTNMKPVWEGSKVIRYETQIPVKPSELFAPGTFELKPWEGRQGGGLTVGGKMYSVTEKDAEEVSLTGADSGEEPVTRKKKRQPSAFLPPGYKLFIPTRPLNVKTGQELQAEAVGVGERQEPQEPAPEIPQEASSGEQPPNNPPEAPMATGQPEQPKRPFQIRVQGKTLEAVVKPGKEFIRTQQRLAARPTAPNATGTRRRIMQFEDLPQPGEGGYNEEWAQQAMMHVMVHHAGPYADPQQAQFRMATGLASAMGMVGQERYEGFSTRLQDTLAEPLAKSLGQGWTAAQVRRQGVPWMIGQAQARIPEVLRSFVMGEGQTIQQMAAVKQDVDISAKSLITTTLKSSTSPEEKGYVAELAGMSPESRRLIGKVSTGAMDVSGLSTSLADAQILNEIRKNYRIGQGLGGMKQSIDDENFIDLTSAAGALVPAFEKLQKVLERTTDDAERNKVLAKMTELEQDYIQTPMIRARRERLGEEIRFHQERNWQGVSNEDAQDLLQNYAQAVKQEAAIQTERGANRFGGGSRFMRAMIGGWGLMYMGHLAQMPLGQWQYGYQEAQQYQTQMAAYGAGIMGNGAISPFPAIAYAQQRNMAASGGTGFAALQAMGAQIPGGVRDITGVGVAGLTGTAMTLYMASAAQQAGWWGPATALSKAAPIMGLLGMGVGAYLTQRSYDLYPEQNRLAMATDLYQGNRGGALEGLDLAWRGITRPNETNKVIGQVAVGQAWLAGTKATMEELTPEQIRAGKTSVEPRAMNLQELIGLQNSIEAGATTPTIESIQARLGTPQQALELAQQMAQSPEFAGLPLEATAKAIIRLNQAGKSGADLVKKLVSAEMSGVPTANLAEQMMNVYRQPITAGAAVGWEETFANRYKTLYEAGQAERGLQMMGQLPGAYVTQMFGPASTQAVDLAAQYWGTPQGELIARGGQGFATAQMIGGAIVPTTLPPLNANRTQMYQAYEAQVRQDIANQGLAQAAQEGMGPSYAGEINDLLAASGRKRLQGERMLQMGGLARQMGYAPEAGAQYGRNAQQAALFQQSATIEQMMTPVVGQENAQMYMGVMRPWMMSSPTASSFAQNFFNANPITMTQAALAGAPINPVFANADVSQIGRQVTGLPWGTTSLFRAGVGNVGTQILGSALAGTGAGNAAINGVTLPNGQTYGGMWGLQWYAAQRGYEYQQAQAGNQLAQIALQEKYQPMFWGIEDRQRALSNQQAQWGFQQQAAQIQMQSRQFYENLGMQQQQTQMQRGFTQVNWGFQDTQRALNWQWRQEDWQENLRFMTGRERRLGERQRERETISFNLEGEQISTQRRQQKEMWRLEDQRFEMTKRHYEEQKDFQTTALAKQKEFYEQGRALQDEQIALQRAYWKEQIELQKAAAGAAAGYAKDMKDVQDAMTLIGQQQDLYAGKLKVAQSNEVQLINTLITGFNWIVANWTPEKIRKMLEEGVGMPQYEPVGDGNNNPYDLKAIGGPILPNVPTVVGEYGPELINTPIPMSVMPNNELKSFRSVWQDSFVSYSQAPRGGASGPVVINVCVGNEKLASFFLKTLEGELEVAA